MLNVKITALRRTEYPDLSALYENPMDTPCSLSVGQVFLSVDATMPKGFCDSAWQTIQPFVRKLAAGGGNFYDGWMKDPHTALLSCNDGFRPVSFLLEAEP